MFGVPSQMGGLPEREQVIGYLERGTAIQKFCHKSKPEKKTMLVRRETMLIVWQRALSGKNSFDGCIDIREIKEVRRGKNSRDFDKWAEETGTLAADRCFIIFYGSEFNLSSLSIFTLGVEECYQWMKGLKYLMEDVSVSQATYGLTLQRWFRKCFYEMEQPGKEGTISSPELKKFLSKVNCKLPNKLLKEKTGLDTKNSSGDIYFDDFCTILQDIIFSPSLFTSNFSSYSSDGKKVTVAEFQKFLSCEQGLSESLDSVAGRMREFLVDPSRNTQTPYFSLTEFVDWLFSSRNTILAPVCKTVYHDMTRPLSHYFVASSHNTYLTGDQIKSASSVEAYARCLRMGCRCIELDCWDGPDGMPFIFHGHTITSKIRFLDVIKTIKDHAFVTSEYPVILSIEDHCSIPQQKKMATAFQEVFGEMLVSSHLDKNETELPSPERLRRKIILKHKKLPEFVGDSTNSVAELDVTNNNLDEGNSVKKGILMVREDEDGDLDCWLPRVFVLTSKMLVFSELETEEIENNDEGEASSLSRKNTNASLSSLASRADVDVAELHFSEPWFHRNLARGRSSAEEILRTNKGDGTFLVRPSDTFVGDYSLSFWRREEVHHVPIRIRQVENGVKRFYLIDQVFFDSLYDLILHYQSHPLRSSKFQIVLGEAAPQPNRHEDKPWFHPNIGRDQAHQMLLKLMLDGAFLLRSGERVQNSFAISFMADKKVKHCLIKKEGRLFLIGTAQFESLVDLVAHYEKSPLYKKVKLKTPVTEEVLARRGNLSPLSPSGSAEAGGYSGEPSGYMDPNLFTSRTCARAQYEYKARRDDELSFPAGALITNVSIQKPDAGWWRGDYGALKSHWFPANFTRLEENQDSLDITDSQESPDNLQRGTIDIVEAEVELLGSGLGFRLKSSSSLLWTELRCNTGQEAQDWVDRIKEVSTSAVLRDTESRRRERSLRIALELSNLVIYCKSVIFSQEKMSPGHFTEMSSFPETKAEKLMFGPNGDPEWFLKYHRHQISRIYPKAQRVGSDNYNPLPMWGCGSQMTALNYQTGDKPMQLNQAKFLDNGQCGYILRPEFMFRDGYIPSDQGGAAEIGGISSLDLEVTILAARHLYRSVKKFGSQRQGLLSPLVEVEVLGCDYDSVKHKTKTITDNGLNPVWDETFNLRILNPEMALVRFSIYDEDMFGDPNFIGHATYPVKLLVSGYRSIQLKNGYSEELELSSLLVKVSSSQGDTASQLAVMLHPGVQGS